MKDILKKQTIFVLIVIAFLTFLIFSNDGYLKSSDVLKENKFGMRFIAPDENRDAYVREEMSICFKNGLDDCYKQVADLFTNQFGYKNILSIFKSNEQYPEIFSRCHEVTHFIGRNAYSTNPNIPKLYEDGSSVCWGGFYHGVIEEYFGSKHLDPFDPNNFSLITQLKDVCGSRSDYSVPRYYEECLHGIGHAMMFITSSDLPKSLKWCDSLAMEEDRNTCYGGVFMENSSSSTSIDHPSKYIKADDPFYPCDSLEEKYLNICYTYQSSYFGRISNYNVVKNAGYCSQVPKDYQSGCFYIIGSNEVGNTEDPQKMNNTCKQMPSYFAKKNCISGSALGLGGRYVGEPEKIKNLCYVVDKDVEQICWISYGVVVSTWYPDKTEASKMCNLSDKQKNSWCKQGITGNYVDLINK